ncbi:MAG: pilus assembly protein, partial [Acidimicrobiales bacterium]|nr:pilus assembly protein [Acidimicrobiales bacterium]
MKPSNHQLDAQRSAALIEAAVAMPVLLLLVFGILEMGMLMRDNLTLAQATRDGARAASAFGNIDGADFRTLQIIEQAANAVPDKVVTRVVIFDPGVAEVDGTPSVSCKAGIAVVNECNVYTIADLLEPYRFGDCTDTTTLDYYYCPSDRD